MFVTQTQYVRVSEKLGVNSKKCGFGASESSISPGRGNMLADKELVFCLPDNKSIAFSISFPSYSISYSC
jgi:hypothetical protein